MLASLRKHPEREDEQQQVTVSSSVIGGSDMNYSKQLPSNVELRHSCQSSSRDQLLAAVHESMM